jgi:hypothetical protein
MKYYSPQILFVCLISILLFEFETSSSKIVRDLQTNNTIQNNTNTNGTSQNGTSSNDPPAPTPSTSPVPSPVPVPDPGKNPSVIPPNNSTEPVNPNSNNSASNITEQPYQDIIQSINYKSKLTDEQRGQTSKGYYYWVNYKNSFNAESSSKLAKLTKYYEPENENYYTNLNKYGIPFHSISGLFALLLIIYLIMRFFMGYFKGPKTHISNWYGYFSWLLIIFGFFSAIILFCLSLSNNYRV